jgi:hypothetical protein
MVPPAAALACCPVVDTGGGGAGMRATYESNAASPVEAAALTAPVAVSVDAPCVRTAVLKACREAGGGRQKHLKHLVRRAWRRPGFPCLRGQVRHMHMPHTRRSKKLSNAVSGVFASERVSADTSACCINLRACARLAPIPALLCGP